MFFKRTSTTLAAAFALLALPSINADGGSGQCSYHPYIQVGLTDPGSYTKQTTSCGTEYGHLNIGYVMSIDDGTGLGCNRCYAVTSQATGKQVYILGVDRKGSPGLDIGESAWADLGHDERSDTSSPLHYAQVQQCKWREVDASNCAGICKSQTPELDCTSGCEQSTAYSVFDAAADAQKEQALARCAGSPLLPDSTGMVDYKDHKVNQGYIDSINRGTFTPA